MPQDAAVGPLLADALQVLLRAVQATVTATAQPLPADLAARLAAARQQVAALVTACKPKQLLRRFADEVQPAASELAAALQPFGSCRSSGRRPNWRWRRRPLAAPAPTCAAPTWAGRAGRRRVKASAACVAGGLHGVWVVVVPDGLQFCHWRHSSIIVADLSTAMHCSMPPCPLHSGCRAVWYCGTACSHADWREGHRRVCKALGAARQAEKEERRQQQEGQQGQQQS